MKRTHKKQHFIPKCYLEAWCDSKTPKGHDPYVWQFDKDGIKSKKKAPKNIFHETDMYTIEAMDGKRNLVLEHGLAGIEGAFVTIRDDKIKLSKPFDDEERFIVCIFVAAMSARTKSFREHHKEQWSKISEYMGRLDEWIKTAKKKDIENAAKLPTLMSKGKETGLNYEQVKELAVRPLQKMLFPVIKSLAPLLYKLDLALLETSSVPGFITSDSPCVWFDLDSCKRPPLYQAPALIYPTTEITFPVTPKHMILFNRKGFEGVIELNQLLTDELNRRTRFDAYEHFIVNKDIKKEIWFDPGKEPDDSWNKLHNKDNID